jgi:hypothetical protein
MVDKKAELDEGEVTAEEVFDKNPNPVRAAAQAIMDMGSWKRFNPPRLEGVTTKHGFWHAIYSRLMEVADAQEKEQADKTGKPHTPD